MEVDHLMYRIVPGQDIFADEVIIEGLNRSGEKDKIIDIPESIQGIDVTTIMGNAFSCEKNIEKIIIPRTVCGIGYDAFRKCKNLKEIVVDKENQNYSSLDGILYTKDMSKLLYVPDNKISVTIPDSVSDISVRAFRLHKNLKYLYIGSGVEKLGSESFYGCTNLTDIRIGENVKAIRSWAFFKCVSLKSITIPRNVEYLDIQAFAACINLEDIIVDKFNNKYSSLAGVLYDKNKESLLLCPEGKDNVVIPSNTLYIMSNAFMSCRLKKIKIPATVKKYMIMLLLAVII